MTSFQFLSNAQGCLGILLNVFQEIPGEHIENTFLEHFQTNHKLLQIREVFKRAPFRSLLLRGGGVGGNVKKLRSFFINQAFFGGVLECSWTLELRDYVKYMFFSPFHSSL